MAICLLHGVWCGCAVSFEPQYFPSQAKTVSISSSGNSSNNYSSVAVAQEQRWKKYTWLICRCTHAYSHHRWMDVCVLVSSPFGCFSCDMWFYFATHKHTRKHSCLHGVTWMSAFALSFLSPFSLALFHPPFSLGSFPPLFIHKHSHLSHFHVTNNSQIII